MFPWFSLFYSKIINNSGKNKVKKIRKKESGKGSEEVESEQYFIWQEGSIIG